MDGPTHAILAMEVEQKDLIVKHATEKADIRAPIVMVNDLVKFVLTAMDERK